MGIEIAFGNVLKMLRNEKGVSQEKLAELCNLDRTFISLLERGRRQPTITTLFLIAEALHVPAHEIVAKVESSLKHGDENKNDGVTGK
jgi:transcriptional regulator with XRE-family HTH domain